VQRVGVPQGVAELHGGRGSTQTSLGNSLEVMMGLNDVLINSDHVTENDRDEVSIMALSCVHDSGKKGESFTMQLHGFTREAVDEMVLIVIASPDQPLVNHLLGGMALDP
jgi:hypothetical protein